MYILYNRTYVLTREKKNENSGPAPGRLAQVRMTQGKKKALILSDTPLKINDRYTFCPLYTVKTREGGVCRA